MLSTQTTNTRDPDHFEYSILHYPLFLKEWSTEISSTLQTAESDLDNPNLVRKSFPESDFLNAESNEKAVQEEELPRRVGRPKGRSTTRNKYANLQDEQKQKKRVRDFFKIFRSAAAASAAPTQQQQQQEKHSSGRPNSSIKSEVFQIPFVHDYVLENGETFGQTCHWHLHWQNRQKDALSNNHF